MANQAATGAGSFLASIPHPTCDAITATLQCSTDVKIGGTGIVRQGDLVAVHTILVGKVCVPHQTGLVSYSTSVRINGKGAGRVGDAYACGCLIQPLAIPSSKKVNIGG